MAVRVCTLSTIRMSTITSEFTTMPLAMEIQHIFYNSNRMQASCISEIIFTNRNHIISDFEAGDFDSLKYLKMFPFLFSIADFK